MTIPTSFKTSSLRTWEKKDKIDAVNILRSKSYDFKC